MKKRIIEISVNDEYVVGSGVVIGAAGDDESMALRVSFNDTWLGLNIYATFRDAKGENPTAFLLLPSLLVPGEVRTYDVVVPAAATKHDGKMSVVFSGFAITESYLYAKDGDTVVKELVYRDAVINTTNAYFRVLPSDFSALDVEDQTEASTVEQMLAEMNRFHERLNEHETSVEEALEVQDVRVAEIEGVVAQFRKEADEGAFKGEKGDRGEQGEQGIQGEKGDKGEKGDAGVIEFIIVTELPTKEIKNAIYLVPTADTDGGDAFDEYIYVNGGWEPIGNAGVQIDLSQYATQAYVDDKVGDISAALDELHAYAEALKGGEA
jgi:hypothetical protein